MAVASYGEFDYYKCKFCRYVAPVNMKMRQEYSYEYYDDNDHILNSVNGLEYSMIETHNYNKLPVWLNKTQHSIACICGNRVIRGHAVSSSNTSRCIICGGNVSAGIISPFAANNTIYVTDNGSYMLPNGVIVLDEKDIKLYMDGKLNFYNENLSTS